MIDEHIAHTDRTMTRVYDALRLSGLNHGNAMAAITSMQTAGILFREQEYTAEEFELLPHSRACMHVYHKHGPECHKNCLTCGGKYLDH